jgi:ABC-2 type transport system ATP-binding protein
VPTPYAAYGLAVSSDFALPGLRPRRAPDLPSLVLRMAGGDQPLEWQLRGAERPSWTGHLRDGCALTVDRLARGEVHFRYGERASFRLAPGHGLLECAPRERGAEWRRVLAGKLLGIVSVMRGYEALHASAVDSPYGLLALVGPSGVGKSTLARELAGRGWTLFTDDTLPLALGSAGVRAHPAASAGSRPLRALCLLERAPGLELDARVLESNPLPLAPHMLGFQGDAERQRRRFELFGDLASCCTMVRVSAGMGDRPAQIADLIERAALAGRGPVRGPALRPPGERARARTPGERAGARGAAPAPAPAAPLALLGVTKRWRRQPAPLLDGIELRLQAGTMTWIGGRNGVGKTTLLRIAAGLIDADRGEALAGGVSARADRRRFQRLVSLLPAGDRGLYARISVRHHLEFCARIALLPRERLGPAVEQALDAFALRELAGRRVDRISMGQRQRLRAAMAFLPAPEVVLLDEPLTSLDEQGADLLRAAAGRVCARGGAVLWCSPTLGPTDGGFDARLLLERGRLVDVGERSR